MQENALHQELVPEPIVNLELVRNAIVKMEQGGIQLPHSIDITF